MVLPVTHSGRWLIDATGRVLLVHGINFVVKNAGETPASRGFGADDIAWIKDNGFDAVRLGLSPNNVMPTPGVVDAAYLDAYAQTAHALTAAGLLVLVDLHQDGWGPAVCGNGFPDWMTLTQGATNTCTGFPLYYITNPAIQASFQSFWANAAGPGGVGLQDQVAAMFAALAAKVGSDPGILGYEILNEPWPGTTWQPCLDPPGCPDQDHASLDPFHAKVTAAVRSKDTGHLVFGEPFVLFNFGQASTDIATPGNDSAGGMAFHMYVADVSKEPVVLQNAIDWSARTGGAVLATEFGAISSPAGIDRELAQLDAHLMPWMWWTYDEFMHNLDQTASDANADMGVVDALVRPHPVAFAGTPSAVSYDRSARVLRTRWSTTGPNNRTYPEGTVTTFQIPARTYAGGYQVKVEGGTVTSPAGATTLTVAASPGAAAVSVTVWPAGQVDPDLTVPPTTTVAPTVQPAFTG